MPLLQFLPQRGAEVNLELQGRTALWQAIQRGDDKIVQLLLTHGVLLNRKDSDGQTPVHHAVHPGSAAVVSAWTYIRHYRV
jgi:ankyrin repeat protein